MESAPFQSTAPKGTGRMRKKTSTAARPRLEPHQFSADGLLDGRWSAQGAAAPGGEGGARRKGRGGVPATHQLQDLAAAASPPGAQHGDGGLLHLLLHLQRQRQRLRRRRQLWRLQWRRRLRWWRGKPRILQPVLLDLWLGLLRRGFLPLGGRCRGRGLGRISTAPADSLPPRHSGRLLALRPVPPLFGGCGQLTSEAAPAPASSAQSALSALRQPAGARRRPAAEIRGRLARRPGRGAAPAASVPRPPPRPPEPSVVTSVVQSLAAVWRASVLVKCRIRLRNQQ